jgi:hypothetical protein
MNYPNILLLLRIQSFSLFQEKSLKHRIPPSKNVHYSRCQLFIGNHDFPPHEGGGKPTATPYVFFSVK